VRIKNGFSVRSSARTCLSAIRHGGRCRRKIHISGYAQRVPGKPPLVPIPERALKGDRHSRGFETNHLVLK